MGVFLVCLWGSWNIAFESYPIEGSESGLNMILWDFKGGLVDVFWSILLFAFAVVAILEMKGKEVV
jgi:hypothetical protein